MTERRVGPCYTDNPDGLMGQMADNEAWRGHRVDLSWSEELGRYVIYTTPLDPFSQWILRRRAKMGAKDDD